MSPRLAAASVLDRLLDAEPDKTKDGPVNAARTLVEYRRAVHRDVEHLLNARRPWRTQMSQALRSTSLGYGLSDFTAGAFNDVREQERLRAEILDVLQRFEPRLADIDVRIVDDGMPLRGMLKLRISATLLVEPLPEAIAFDSLIDTTTADFVLRPVAG